jgi:amidase
MDNVSPSNLASASAAQLAEAVAARRVSAVELCDAAIERIERLDVEINAVVVRDFARARIQAQACDDAVKRGDRGALLGVPMTVKESHNVAGLPTTWGLEPFRDFRAAQDGVLVARLKAAGAVILGKTNVPPSLGDWQSDNPIYGRSLNPYDPKRTPGGSSGGAAAAVAAGMVPLELGSDIGGSIRVPAHFCGIFGHKPSHGVLPLRGHSFPGVDGAEVDLAVAGPLARTASDLELAMSVLAGPDSIEAVGYRLDLPPPRHASLATCRVLLLDEHPCARTDTQIRSALDKLAGDMSRAGARIERSTALLPDLNDVHQSYWSMLWAIMTRGQPGEQQVISAHEWLTLIDKQMRVRRKWSALFESFDVVLAPPFGTLAFEHIDEPDWSKRTLRIDGVETPYGEQLAWAGPASFGNLPSTVAPIARSVDGLPIGVQIIGPYLGDRTTMAVARQIEHLAR